MMEKFSPYWGWQVGRPSEVAEERWGWGRS